MNTPEHKRTCELRSMPLDGRCTCCLMERQQIADLRDAIRLIIGRQTNVPWGDVPQADVDEYLDAIRRIKSRENTRSHHG